jgi:hypothetical protein
MIFNYNTLHHKVEEIAHILKESRPKVQKLYSTSRHWCFVLRVPGKTLTLAIGRGAGVEGLFLFEGAIPSEIRIVDKSLEYLRKHVRNKSLINIEVDKNDRIISIVFGRKTTQERMYFFWRGRDLLFSHYARNDSWKLQLSNYPAPKELFELSFSEFDAFGRSNTQKEMERIDFDDYQEVVGKELSRLQKNKTQKRRRRKLEKKRDNIVKDIQKINSFLAHEQALQLGDEQVIDALSKKFKIEGLGNIFKKRDFLFNKLKDYRKGFQIAQKRYDQVLDEIQGDAETDVVKSTLRAINSFVLNKNNQSKSIVKESKVRGYSILSQGDFQYGLGLNAQGNDAMRREWGKPEDIWVHASEGVSPHIIIKSNEELTNKLTDALREAARIICEKMDNRKEIEIVYTKVKNIKGIKKKPGTVTYKKEKRLKFYLD